MASDRRPLRCIAGDLAFAYIHLNFKACHVDQHGNAGSLVVKGYGNAARATVFTRERGAFSENVFFNASVKPLPGFTKVKEFVF